MLRTFVLRSIPRCRGALCPFQNTWTKKKDSKHAQSHHIYNIPVPDHHRGDRGIASGPTVKGSSAGAPGCEIYHHKISFGCRAPQIDDPALLYSQWWTKQHEIFIAWTHVSQVYQLRYKMITHADFSRNFPIQTIDYTQNCNNKKQFSNVSASCLSHWPWCIIKYRLCMARTIWEYTTIQTSMYSLNACYI